MMRTSILAGALWATLLLLVCARPAFSEEVGNVVEVAGTVTIVRGELTLPAAAGTPLEAGDLVRTGRPGRARLVFQEDTVMTVADGSELRVDESKFRPQDGAASSLFSLLVGKARLLVSDNYGQAGASLEVETVTAVAGVRGTEFVVAFSSKSRVTEILAVKGSVRVHSVIDLEGPGVLLRAGELTAVAEGSLPTPPRKAKAGEAASLQEGLVVGGPGATDLAVDQAQSAKSDPGEEGRAARTTPAPSAAENLDKKPPAFPGDRLPSTPADVLGEPPSVLRKGGGTGVEF